MNFTSWLIYASINLHFARPVWNQAEPWGGRPLSGNTSSIKRGIIWLADYTILNAKYECRHVGGHHLADARPKLVQQVHARVAANRRTEIAERRRTGARSIATGSTIGSDRSQHPEKIVGVQLALSRLVARDKNSRSRIRRSIHHLVAG